MKLFFGWCDVWQFHAGVMLDSSMSLMRWPTGKVSNTGGGVHWFASNFWLTVSAPPCTMQRSQSARETSSHYWSLGGMQEDWNDVHTLVWRKAVPSSSSTLRGWGIPDVAVWQMLDPPSDPPSRSHLWNVDQVSIMLAVRPMKTTHQGPLPWRAGSSSGHSTRWLCR